MQFDLIVLGTEQAGLLAALRAAERGLRVAVVNDPSRFPRHKTVLPSYPASISYFSGFIKFALDESLEITDSNETRRITGDRILFACGDRPKRPAHLPFDGELVFDSDEAREIKKLPGSLLIVGAGRHGVSVARSLWGKNGDVMLVDADDPRSEVSSIHSRESAYPIRWRTTVLGIERRRSEAVVFFGNGSREIFDMVVIAVGRLGNLESLNLPGSDTLLDETGRFWCGDFGQTDNPRFYAVGSAVGFPHTKLSPAEEAANIISHAFPPAISTGRVPIPAHVRNREPLVEFSA